jgi:hypothetical protein
VNRGGSGTVDLLANDSDPDGSLAPGGVEIAEPPSHGSLTIDGGVAEYTHDGSNTVSDWFRYTLAGNDGATSEATPVMILIESDNGPTVSNDNITVEQGASTTIDVLANDNDPNGSLVPSTVRITEGPSYATATAGANGRIEYSHDGRTADADSFTYTVADDDGATYEATVEIVVEQRSDGSESTEESDGESNNKSGSESDEESGSESDDQSSGGSNNGSDGESNNESGSGSGDQSPYTDHDLARIQAEDFDTGGQNVAYYDTSSGNKTGVYRDTDVDLRETGDSSGAYKIARIREGEWWEYTVDVPADGEYTLSARVAGTKATSIDVAVDGSSVATIDVPNIGGQQAWITTDAGTVSLSVGTRTIRLTANGGEFDLDWFGLE